MKAHKVLEVFSGGVFFFLGGGMLFFFNFRECVSDTGTSQFTKQFNDWVKGPKKNITQNEHLNVFVGANEIQSLVRLHRLQVELYNPYKWPYKQVSLGITKNTLLMGVYNTTACFWYAEARCKWMSYKWSLGDSHQLLVVIIPNPKDFCLGRFGGTLGKMRGITTYPLRILIKSRPWNFG